MNSDPAHLGQKDLGAKTIPLAKLPLVPSVQGLAAFADLPRKGTELSILTSLAAELVILRSLIYLSFRPCPDDQSQSVERLQFCPTMNSSRPLTHIGSSAPRNFHTLRPHLLQWDGRILLVMRTVRASVPACPRRSTMCLACIRTLLAGDVADPLCECWSLFSADERTFDSEKEAH